MALFNYVETTLAKRRNDFIRFVENAVGKTFSSSDALVNFAATALRKIDAGATGFETEIWAKAVINVATSPPLHWQELLSVLDTGRFEPGHLTLLRIFADPIGVHERFGLGVPVNDALLKTLNRVMNQASQESVDASEIIRWSGDLQRCGLASVPAFNGQNINALSRFATDLGSDFTRLLYVGEPLVPAPKPVVEPPKKTKTNLRWLARQNPSKYEFCEAVEAEA